MRKVLFGILVFVLLCGAGTGFAGEAREVYAEKGMVSSAHEMASKAGVEILQKGGNAIDAAVATSLALSVVEMHFSGVGGGGFATIRFAKTGEVVFLDYREEAPASATKDMYESEQAKNEKWSSIGGKSVGVPGWLLGLDTMLKKYGTMTFAQVAEPAIRLAEEGWIVEPNQTKWYESMFMPFDKYYDLLEVPFLNEGLPYQPGEKLSMPNLAKTYRLIGEKGPSVFYEGEIGEAFVKEVNRIGGKMTMEDLKNYSVKYRKPVEGTYKGYKIYSAPPASSGGAHIVQALNLMEKMDLQGKDVDSPDRLHVLAEIYRIVFADREKYMADSDFVKVPVEGLSSKEYAATLVDQINRTSTMEKVSAGDPWPFDPSRRTSYKKAGPDAIGFNTTSLAAIDAEGNMVACTNSHNYPAGYVSGYDIILNNHLDDFSKSSASVNAPEPGKRPLSSMSPTIILTPDGSPFMAVGSAGGWRIITAVSQIIMNAIDYGMGMSQAIQQPRIFTYSIAGKPSGLLMEKGIPQSTIDVLGLYGEKVDLRDYGDYFGTSQGILFDRKKGMLNGGADSRRLGVPVGY
ncbi:gamma-glutamyltransferase [Aminivibrio sp.]